MPEGHITHPAAAKVAAAMANPEAHQAPPEPKPVNTPDGIPQPAQPAAPAAAPAAPAQPVTPPSTPTVPSIADATPEQLMARIAELAGEGAVTKEDALTLEMNAAIAKARTQEKNKLYGQITALKTDLQAAQVLNSQLTEATKKLTESIAPPTKPDQPAPTGTPPATPAVTQEMLDKVITAAVSKTAETFQAQIDALTAANTRLEKDRTQADLSSYRNQLIAAHQGSIVEELIMGDSREALDQSLATAMQAHAKIAAKLTQNGTPTSAAAPAKPSIPPVPATTPPASPAIPGGDIPTGGLSMDVFQKDRTKLLASANAAVRESLKGLVD